MKLNIYKLCIICLLILSSISFSNAVAQTASANNNLLNGSVSPISKKFNNPLVSDVGMADPHIKIFNGKAYLYATRDEDKTAQTFVMPDWNIWSSIDLVNWTLETTIYPTETYMGESKSCWAPDAVYKNGHYFFYFSNGNVDTGVMVGKSPTGSFKDALGKPLLPQNLTPAKEYDPTVLIDDDNEQSAYIAFGHHRSNDPDLYYSIAKLNEDMISLAEKPREIKIIGKVDVLGGNDKPTLHKHNRIYYLSAGTQYATSDDVYGPYTKTGDSGNGKYGLNARAHGNYFDWNGQNFHVWCHFFLGKDVARYRESYMTYLHYKDNGEMVDDVNFLDKHFDKGVGQYDANWDKIEAEWFMKAENVEKKESPNGGFEIQHIKNNAILYYPNMNNMDKQNSINFHVSSENSGIIEIRTNNAKGILLGTCKVPKTGGWKSYKTISCNLANSQKVEDISIHFIGDSNDILHLDWFSFNSSK